MGFRHHKLTTMTALIVAVSAGCAATLSAEECATELVHHYTAAPEDMGNGLISQASDFAGYHYPGADWGGSSIEYLDCASGEWVTLEITAVNPDATPRFNKTEEVQAIMAGIPASGVLSYVSDSAKRAGVPYNAGRDDDETCGCKVFYPELRGNKIPYEANT